MRLQASVAAFLLTAILGSAVTYAVFGAEHSRAQAEFDSELTAAVALINERIGQDIAYLIATRAFFQALPEGLSRDSFARYVEDLGLSDSELGLQGLGFSQIIPPGSEPAVTAQMTRDYGNPPGVWPQSSAPLRTAIVLLEPEDARNQAALGFDMYSETIRRAAMDAAMRTDLPAATAPVTLVQEIDSKPQQGVLIYLYLESSEVDAPQGFVYSPVRMGDLFDAAFRRQPLRFELRVWDNDAPEPPLYQTAAFSAADDNAHSASTFTLEVAGRNWQFEARSTAPIMLLSAHVFTLITAMAMLILSFVTALAVQAQSAAVQRARDLNKAQAQMMREKDLHLREMSHRLKNSLTRVVAMARQAARGAGSKEDFVISMNMRLQAMASAQDMLTRSETGSTDLRALLSTELTQIGSMEEGFAELDGPRVQLDPRETQALGLSFHELATNALKYGAGAIEGARLAIHWTLDLQQDRIFLHLFWNEITGVALAEPDRKGFGSQLLETCIRLELGGTLQRSFHDNGLTVEIWVPLTPFLDP